jgi:sugar phosphate isomerase/epimerase
VTVYSVADQLYSSRHFPPLEAHFPEFGAMGYAAIEPWLPAYEADRRDSGAFWQSVGEILARGADLAAPEGLVVAWYNHDVEYRPLADGSRPIDHLLGASDAVRFEIDCGWIVRGGADPAAELARYAGRIEAIQMKDAAPLGTAVEDGWTATGDGIIDWRALVPLIRATAATHLVAEHDNPQDWRAFARRSLAYMRSLGLAAPQDP